MYLREAVNNVLALKIIGYLKRKSALIIFDIHSEKGETMFLFEDAQYDRFFNPLCCKNRRLYYECILKIIETSKQVSLLYEQDVRDSLILYLRNSNISVDQEDDIFNNNRTESENASAILKYFRDCSWISEPEIGRNGDNIATVTPYCRKLIDAIERIFKRETRGDLTNHIFSIYDTLKSALERDHGRTIRPYSNILLPLLDSVSDLKSELFSLKDSIRTIMRIIIDISEVNKFGQFFIKDEMLNIFFKDYFFIKRDGLIPGYVAEIEKMLRQVVNIDVYDKMISEYESLKNVDSYQAKVVIDSQFDVIRDFIYHDYAHEMDYIDKKINNYYNLYSTRMLMVLSNNTNIQTYLNDLLMHLKDMDKENRQRALSQISEGYHLLSYQYIGHKSIERRRKRNPNIKRGAIIPSILTEEEKIKMTQDVLENKDRYSVDKVAHYFKNLLQDRNCLTTSEVKIKNKDDVLMMASSIIYSNSNDFPYSVNFLDGMIETDFASVSDICVKRKTEENE